MLLQDGDEEEFKAWVIKKLELISDGQEIADHDVLADYVLALVRTDDAIPLARQNCIDQLQDFLSEKAERFVDDAFLAIATRNFDATKPSKPARPVYEPPKKYSSEPPGQPNESRKRSYHDWDAEAYGVQDGRIPSFEGAERPMKQPRRGGRGGAYDARGGRQYQARGGAHAGSPSTPFGQGFQMPPMPTPPPGMPQMPPFDPNNPMAAVIAMAQMMAGMLATSAQPMGVRCQDYDLKGFCTRGAACPFEHGDNPFVVTQQNEYNPVLSNITPARVGSFDMTTSPTRRGRGGRGRAAYRGNNKRSEFSRLGPNSDRSITSIVVEGIPDDSYSEESVHEYFGQFGTIEDVTMQPHKRLAIVKYDSYEAAQAAYNSPKSVFDNRFVKVYWFKPEKHAHSIPINGFEATANGFDGGDVDTEQIAEPDFDIEDVARRQEEAQRKHEETQRQLEEAERRKSDIDAQLNAINVERAKMKALLAKKTGGDGTEAHGEEETEQTKALKAKLAELENEARDLGIDPDAVSVVTNGHVSNGGYGYGSSPYRGRGGYRGRGRGRGGYRGGYGSGGFSGSPGFGGRVTKSLDNRPKTIAVTFVEGRYAQHEESLKQYLMFNGLDTAVLMPHPVNEDTALVAFQQRFEGEDFMDAAVYQGPLAASDLPKSLGKVKMEWYKGGHATTAASVSASVNGGGSPRNGDVKMEGTNSIKLQPQQDLPDHEEEPAQVREDMDTYDDEE